MALRPHRPNISSLMFAVYCPWIPSQFSVSAWTQMWDANSGHGLHQRPLSAVWSASKESAGGSSKPPEPVAEHLGLQETCGEEASRTKNQIVHHPSELISESESIFWVWSPVMLRLEMLCDLVWHGEYISLPLHRMPGRRGSEVSLRGTPQLRLIWSVCTKRCELIY